MASVVILIRIIETRQTVTLLSSIVKHSRRDIAGIAYTHRIGNIASETGVLAVAANSIDDEVRDRTGLALVIAVGTWQIAFECHILHIAVIG